MSTLIPTIQSYKPYSSNYCNQSSQFNGSNLDTPRVHSLSHTYMFTPHALVLKRGMHIMLCHVSYPNDVIHFMTATVYGTLSLLFTYYVAT